MSIIESFPAFLLVFVRITAFYVTVPLFSYRTIPAVHKIGFAFFLALVSFQAIEKPPQLDVDGVYMMLAMKEALIGLLLGLIAYMMISAVQIAGSFIDFQMGFAVANVIDPQTGAQSPLVGQFLYTMALLLMLSLNAHHLLLDGIYYSYQYIPVDKMALSFGSEGFAEFIAKSFNTMFITAFQLSAPVVACLFLVDLALGIVARTVPQLNVFVVGLPLKIAITFIMLIICMAVMFSMMQHVFEFAIRTMRDLLTLLGVA
ncbi:flagellar biosynthetic protein FliR [Bacillus sp. GM2]|uniref:Flagellar biosynthetic protein FliR n=5 Tax=Bacillus TaxID=1386 RepID=A0AA90EB22_9BACI|nr:MULTISPECIES: flagellar biosynthetic protein FliR [Bacillus]TWK11929.1 hypothetical protein CHCC20375_2961 [Bacillus licheniformis]EWH22430.1 flagellar biosynthesis protein FliR [Bacillus haynesii]MBU8682385.1 flagellar type III secretion system protein FliR [Bacillus haynesii]MCI4126099.1 flagellar type III secretion system protein FliR [Bacillus haynesii]MCJ2145634.1 flagellar type III secretion system protein FliR [Bacillus sp. B19-2]